MADVKTTNHDASDFEKFRQQMHPEEEAGRPVVPAPRRPIALAFGIFMIIVYVGVGVLFLVNYFNWDESFTWARYLVGILLVLYGIYRGYREFKGSHYYGN